MGSQIFWEQVDGSRWAGVDGVYAAGEKMGKSGVTGAWWHAYPMPFERSVLVTAAMVPPPRL